MFNLASWAIPAILAGIQIVSNITTLTNIVVMAGMMSLTSMCYRWLEPKRSFR